MKNEGTKKKTIPRNKIQKRDPKIQNVRGYWAGSEDKGISQQTVIQNIFPNSYLKQQKSKRYTLRKKPPSAIRFCRTL